jgi:hypothetical protein
MADTLCPVCGADPCYRICPTQDPYQGDQARENEDYEFNARYDDVRERYAATAADADLFYEGEHDSYTVKCACGTLIPDGAAECPPCHEKYIESLEAAPSPVGAVVWHEHPRFIVQTVFNELPRIVNDDDIPF